MGLSIRILSVGYDSGLMASRSMLLRHAGYEVKDATSPREALQFAQSDQLDIILICHTVREAERKELITIVRTQRRLVPILCLRDSDYSTGSVDGCKLVSNAPAELVAAVGSAVNGFSGLHG